MIVENETILEINNIKKHFPISKKGLFSKPTDYVKAVDGINLSIKKGETFGLVGESGCGKSTLSRLITRLIEPDEGEVIFDGQDFLKLKGKALRKERQKIQMVFQNPFESLNPRMKIEDIIGASFDIHRMEKGEERRKKVETLIEKVGLDSKFLSRYPHELSGGQRQRIGIARAIALNPKFIICDESVSALDVSVQSQILNLLNDIQEEFNLTYLFISHDLSVIKNVSHRIAVMYLGKIVEVAEAEELYKDPKHPYTQALLSSIPIPEPDTEYEKNPIELKGDIPSPVNPPKGCNLCTRCPFVMPICHEQEPELDEIEKDHNVACHLYSTNSELKESKVL
ncbi:ABC transporter ATP-binding protein [Pseudogracilibacillus sp. SO30301A]|uniref:ABC transporter ATP-binding protein n=1 Tax=Pseudogracilibacillus sp. SO30301A TaxID=3098291 RepID=UPI00300E2ADD